MSSPKKLYGDPTNGTTGTIAGTSAHVPHRRNITIRPLEADLCTCWSSCMYHRPVIGDLDLCTAHHRCISVLLGPTSRSNFWWSMWADLAFGSFRRLSAEARSAALPT